jgi:hypothetical protein
VTGGDELGGAVGEEVGDAGVVREGLGLVGGVPPPAHDAPLMVQFTGVPDPLTMKPNTVDPPAGTVAL